MANFKPLLGSIFRYIIFGAASYLIVCGLVYFFSDDSIFLPPKQHYKTLPGLHYIDTSAGKIATVYLSNPKAKFTLLYSQGNASDLGYSYRLLQLTAQKGYNVFAYDYNGYGMSEGKPSEKNTYLDIDAAYRYLRDVKHVPANRIIIMAHSLGTGVAVELATHVKAAGLILESPYLSIYRTQTIDSLPLLLFDKFKSIDKIKNVHMPVLIIHGTVDGIVPFSHGVTLFKAANEPKYFFPIVGAGHNDLIAVAKERYWQRLKAFTQTLLTHQGK